MISGIIKKTILMPLRNCLILLIPRIKKFSLFTDFISENQEIFCWGFDFQVLENAYDTNDYSIPVRKALFSALKEIACSGNSRIRERHFTIWMGDYGSENQYFWVAVPYRINSRALNIFDRHFESIEGYMFKDAGRIPYYPFLPMYRYEYGKVIEYGDESMAGKRSIDKQFGTGLPILYRYQVPSESYDMRQRYRG